MTRLPPEVACGMLISVQLQGLSISVLSRTSVVPLMLLLMMLTVLQAHDLCFRPAAFVSGPGDGVSPHVPARHAASVPAAPGRLRLVAKAFTVYRKGGGIDSLRGARPTVGIR